MKNKKTDIIENEKKEMTIEELETLYNRVTKERQHLKEELNKRKQEEETLRLAQLELDKEKRKKELGEAYENYIALASAYARDYVNDSITTTNTFSLNSLLNDPWTWWF
jgi:lipid II:glycine glycyltransferase (peptidoglycan interpeptide bridge formation enzyme)